MRALVCGGRDYDNRAAVFYLMDLLHRWWIFEGIMHGGQRGADTLAGQWGKERKLPVEVFPADWNTHGKKAGPLRNQQMLDLGKPDIVIAFPGGYGTHDMLKRAAAADEKQRASLGQGIMLFDAAAMPHRWHAVHTGLHVVISECVHCNTRQDMAERIGHIVCPMRNPWACKVGSQGHGLPHLQGFCEEIAGHAGDHRFMNATWMNTLPTQRPKP